MKILIVNGVNLNMLGNREKSIYGNKTLEDLENYVKQKVEEKYNDKIALDFFQSNNEGDIVDKIHSVTEYYDALIINPGAYSHYSIAILDALNCIEKPKIEVHISNIHRREEYRHKLVTAMGQTGVICGLGIDGYILAIEYLVLQAK